MNGGGCCTTRTWPPPSSTGSWNEEDSSASMDPRDGHVISNWRTPCQTVQNGSEYLEKTAQNFRNPHFWQVRMYQDGLLHALDDVLTSTTSLLQQLSAQRTRRISKVT